MICQIESIPPHVFALFLSPVRLFPFLIVFLANCPYDIAVCYPSIIPCINSECLYSNVFPFTIPIVLSMWIFLFYITFCNYIFSVFIILFLHTIIIFLSSLFDFLPPPDARQFHRLLYPSSVPISATGSTIKSLNPSCPFPIIPPICASRPLFHVPSWLSFSCVHLSLSFSLFFLRFHFLFFTPFPHFIPLSLLLFHMLFHPPLLPLFSSFRSSSLFSLFYPMLFAIFLDYFIVSNDTFYDFPSQFHFPRFAEKASSSPSLFRP